MRYLLGIILIISYARMNGQITDTIEISYTKSAFLIFPDKITTYEQGSEDVLIRQKENKLIIQSDLATGFKETNLLVECNGEIYLYILKYVEKPKKFMYNYQVQVKDTVSERPNYKENGNIAIDYAAKQKETTNILTEKTNKSIYETNCYLVNEKKQSIFNKGEQKDKIQFIATNLYVHENNFYLKLYIKNTSKIKYDINLIRLSVATIEKGIKPVAGASKEIEPKFVLNGGQRTVEGKGSVSIIYVLDKFTLQNNQKLYIEMLESGGNRKLDIDFFNDDILNAKSL